MNWQHLIYFLVAAKHQNFRKAAEELFIDTSTLSRAMTSLENQLQNDLFYREGRNVRLTKYGKIFLKHVTAANYEIEKGIDEIARISRSQEGEIHLATIFSVGGDLIPKILREFRKEAPSFTVTLEQKTTQGVIRDVLGGNADIGICGEFNMALYEQDIHVQRLYNEEVVLVVPEDHPLANQTSVTLAEIQDEIFIGYNDRTGLYLNIKEAVDKLSNGTIELKHIYEANEDSAVAGMVRAGLGIAFISESARIDYTGVKKIQLSDLYVMRDIYMIWRKLEFTPHNVNRLKNYISFFTETMMSSDN